MELGTRGDCVAGNSLEEKLSAAKIAGCDFFELPVKIELIDELDGGRMDAIRESAEKAGLPIKNASMDFKGFAALTAEERRHCLARVRKLIDLNSLCGGGIILLASREEGIPMESYQAVYKEEMQDVADYAGEKGVTLSLEPVGRIKPSIIDNLVREISHPSIRMYYDMGNCLYGGEDPLEQAELSADITAAIHIKGGPDNSLSDMPLEEILRVFENVEYSGRGCLELSPDDGGNSHIEKALDMLRRIGY